MSSGNSGVCAIYGCKNKNQKKQRKHIFFYRFPKVRDVAKKWVIASNRSDLVDILETQDSDHLYKKRYMVCSNHFESTCFRNKNLLSEGLNKTAVPTKNLIHKRSIIESCPANMVEITIKIEQQICYGCLSTNRRTSPLGHLTEMLSTLVGTAITKDPPVFCWECTAVLRRLHRFQNQLKHAQNLLSQIYQSTQSLSSLTITQKDYYDHEIHSDHAVDEYSECKDDFNGVKEENDSKTTVSNETVKENVLNETVKENVLNETVKENVLNEIVEENEFIDQNGFDSADNESNQSVNSNRVKIKRTDVTQKRKLNSWKNIKKEYKSYAKHIRHNNWKKPYTQYFTKIHLDEAEIELNFLRKDRKRQGYKMHLKCKVCLLIYGRKIDLDRHNNLNHHKPNTSYKCLHCKEPQSSLESLKEHWRSHSVFYKCNTCCSAVFPCSLALHLSRSHVNVYACTSCTLSFSSLVSFSEHYNKNHPFVCDYCNKRCALRSVLEKHIRNHHTAQNCVACERKFDSHKLYRAHCREMHPDVLNIGAEPEMCYCVECDRQFPSRALYMKHVNSKHTVKLPTLRRTPCPECGKAFNKNSDMLLHYNFSHVKITKYHCDLCDKYFLKMYGLRTHMESVHLKLPKQKNKICDLCGRAFQSNSVLDNHRRTHTGERPFKCGVCPAAFAQKGAMKIHQRKQHAA